MENSDDFNPESAYDCIAPLFDSSMRAENEVASHGSWLERTLRALDARAVIDSAAGTGAQTLQLCEGGHFDCIVASDASAAMLDICRGKLTAMGVHYENAWAPVSATTAVVVMESTWADLPLRLPRGAWDVILCLGYSLPHLCTTDRFIQVLAGWRTLLRPGGYLLFDFGVNFSQAAASARAGTFQSTGRNWTVEEERDQAGTVHVVATGREFLEDSATPLGWKIRVQKVIAALSDVRAISDPRTFAYETALLDEEAVRFMTREVGFDVSELPCGVSPRLHVNVRDLLLTKPR